VPVRAGAARYIYGEWLGRQNRRVDARGELRIAHEMFTSIGMEAFAERARRELLATGSAVRKRSVATRDNLTAQERQIALLARDGTSNIDIAARLFLSQHTVAITCARCSPSWASARAASWLPRSRAPRRS
jgi:DNA-binding NarL/FixJ family response regulator